MDPSEAGSTTPTNHETRTALELVQYNQRRHINSLPPEILHIVFLPVGRFDRGYYTCLFTSRMVCKYWMEVIDSTPKLWNSISSRLHQELQAMIMQNSRSRLLAVEYNEAVWESGDRQREKKKAAFESLMKPSSSRWQVLEYRASYRGGGERILLLPMHNLERIKADGPAPRDQSLTLDAPKLSYVDVRHWSLNWRSLSGLQVLILHTTDLSLSDLMVILKASPGLRSLSLGETLLNVGQNGFPKSFTNKIFLPQLRALNISMVLAKSVSFLLDWIEAPNLEIFNVMVGDPRDREDYTQLCESVGRYIGAFPLPKNQNQTRVLIDVRDGVMKFGVGERRISIWNRSGRIANNGGFNLACITSVLKQLDSRICEEVNMLDLACDGNEGTGACLRIVHSRFPWIDQILVMDDLPDKPGTQAVLQHLSSPSQLGSSEEWLLPKLTKLGLGLNRPTDKYIVDKIVELFKKRAESEWTEDITELRITAAAGGIDPNVIEILRRSVILFDLEVPAVQRT